MAAITEAQLADGLEQIYDDWSDRTDISPAEARRAIAVAQASLIAQFTIGRQAIGIGYNGVQVISTIE